MDRRFLEGRAGGTVPQNDGLDAERSGAVLHGGPEPGGHVEIGHRLEIAVQVEHDVVAHGEADEQVLQPEVGGRARGQLGQRTFVGASEEREVAVEIGAGSQMEAALQFAEMVLGASHRIGCGHDGDVAEDAAFGFGGAQLRHQRVDGDDARQLAGVQRGLDRRVGALRDDPLKRKTVSS